MFINDVFFFYFLPVFYYFPNYSYFVTIPLFCICYHIHIFFTVVEDGEDADMSLIFFCVFYILYPFWVYYHIGGLLITLKSGFVLTTFRCTYYYYIICFMVNFEGSPLCKVLEVIEFCGYSVVVIKLEMVLYYYWIFYGLDYGVSPLGARPLILFIQVKTFPLLPLLSPTSMSYLIVPVVVFMLMFYFLHYLW